MTAASKARQRKKDRLPARVLNPPRSVATLRSDTINTLRIDGSRFDVEARDGVVGSSVDRTIEGGSTVSIDVHDRDQILTTTDFLDADHDALLDNDILLTLDGLRFALARMENTHPVYKVIFEDYVVAALKSATRPRKAYRDKVTRAEFIFSLVDELGFDFYCPELMARQPIGRVATSTVKEPKANRNPGFSPGAKVTVKGQAASKRQLQVIDDCLVEAASLGASEFVCVCVVACITQESSAGEAQGQTGNDDIGIYQQGRNWISVADAKKGGPSTKAFLITGPTSFKKRHGSIKLKGGDVESLLKAVQISVGGYGAWVAEAGRTVKAFLGGNGGLSLASGGSIDVAQRYAFRVGEAGKPESYWDCMQRLAVEVGFRCFVVGDTVVYMSEPELIAQRPAMAIWRQAPGVTKLEGVWDRSHTVQEASLTVDVARWGAQPGQVVDVINEGPLSGRWLVSTTSRALTKSSCDIALKRPQAPKAEPAPQTKSVSVPGSPSSAGLGRGGPVRDRIIAVAESTLSSKTGFIRYSQAGASNLTDPTPKTGRTDCSQWIAAVYSRAGAGFPGANTYEMAAKGKRTTNPRPGDIMLTANNGHCEIFVGGDKTYGHGSPPIDAGSVKYFAGAHFVTFDFLDK